MRRFLNEIYVHYLYQTPTHHRQPGTPPNTQPRSLIEPALNPGCHLRRQTTSKPPPRVHITLAQEPTTNHPRRNSTKRTSTSPQPPSTPRTLHRKNTLSPKGQEHRSAPVNTSSATGTRCSLDPPPDAKPNHHHPSHLPHHGVHQPHNQALSLIRGCTRPTTKLRLV